MSQDHDPFEEFQGVDTQQYDALKHTHRPEASANRDGTGITYRLVCPRCVREYGINVGWAELFCVAAAFPPNYVDNVFRQRQIASGMDATAWQANKENATGYGPAVSCPQCQYQHAPFTISFVEAKGLLEEHPEYKENATVRHIAPMVGQLFQARQKAQGQR
jgi:hypothetical protein